MSELRFTWHEAKAAANLRNHKVTFEEAKTVFSDERARLIDDPDHSVGEERFVLLGLSASLKVLLVCHCYRESGQVIHLISARKASRNEAKFYGR